jgi:hypothetical protein
VSQKSEMYSLASVIMHNSMITEIHFLVVDRDL